MRSSSELTPRVLARRGVLAAGGCAATLLLYWANAGFNHNLPITNAYLLPIAAVAWAAGLGAAVVVSGVATVAVSSGGVLSLPAVAVSAALHFATALVLSTLRIGYDRERRLARTDVVTGAANRRAFDEGVRRLVREHLRRSRPLTAVVIDLDGFKLVNDSLGHDEGDEVLRSVAEALIRSVRATDLVARYGGDEFAILLVETDARGANTLLLRLHEALDTAMRGRGWPVTFSIGAISFDRPPPSERQLMRLVDAQMYEAKNGGKNRLLHTVHQPT